MRRWIPVFLAALLLALPHVARAGLLEDAVAGRARIIDLTHPLAAGIPIYPGGVPFRAGEIADIHRDGYFANLLVTGEHTGTHVDAPAHFVAGAATLDALPADRFVAPAVVIDGTGPAERNADWRLTADEVRRWESEHGPVPQGAVVFLRTGWGRRWPNAAAYGNQAGNLRFPGYSVDAARYLVEARSIRGLGIDTLSLDHGRSRDFAVHHYLFAQGRYGIENVARLEDLPAQGAVVVVAPIPVAGGSGAPCRVLAFAP